MAYQNLQGGSTSFLAQNAGNVNQAAPQSTGGNLAVQGANTSGASLNTSPYGNGVRQISNTGVLLGANTQLDPAVAAADAKAAADAAAAAKLRGNITDLVQSIKDIFNSRYGNLNAAAQEQSAALDQRFGNESQDLTTQIGQQTDLAGAQAAAGGVYDSSYRANNQDTITHAGQSQIRDLGQELADNKAAIGAEVLKQRQGYDAQKSSYDTVLSHLAEETDPGRLTDLRNTLDAKIAELQAGGADYSTKAQSISALNKIAPSTARAVQLKTTLAKIVGGDAPASQKMAVGQQLIDAAGLSGEDKQKLLLAFQSDLSSTPEDKTQQPA